VLSQFKKCKFSFLFLFFVRKSYLFILFIGREEVHVLGSGIVATPQETAAQRVILASLQRQVIVMECCYLGSFFSFFVWLGRWAKPMESFRVLTTSK